MPERPQDAEHKCAAHTAEERLQPRVGEAGPADLFEEAGHEANAEAESQKLRGEAGRDERTKEREHSQNAKRRDEQDQPPAPQPPARHARVQPAETSRAVSSSGHDEASDGGGDHDHREHRQGYQCPVAVAIDARQAKNGERHARGRVGESEVRDQRGASQHPDQYSHGGTNLRQTL